MLSAISHKQRYFQTDLTVKIAAYEFKSTGKKEIDKGFKAIQDLQDVDIRDKKDIKDNKKKEELSYGDSIIEGYETTDIKFNQVEKKTSPPAYYTEATLLSTMENANRHLESENKNQDEVNRSFSIGTPATRSSIIEKIVTNGFIKREGKNLIATEKAYHLTSILPDELTSVIMTSEWEHKLEKINEGELPYEEFINEIKVFVDNLTKRGIKERKNGLIKQEQSIVGKCLRCKKNVIEYKKTFACEDNGFGCGFVLWKANSLFSSQSKELTRDIVEKLLQDGRVYVEGFKSKKTNKKYNANVILKDTGKYVNLELEFENKKKE